MLIQNQWYGVHYYSEFMLWLSVSLFINMDVIIMFLPEPDNRELVVIKLYGAAGVSRYIWLPSYNCRSKNFHNSDKDIWAFSATTKTFIILMFMLQKTQKSAGLSDWEPLLIHKTQSLKNFYFLISQNMLLSSLLSAFPFLHEGYIAKQVVDGKGKDWLASKQRRVTVGQKQQRLPLVTLAASPYPLALSS